MLTAMVFVIPMKSLDVQTSTHVTMIHLQQTLTLHVSMLMETANHAWMVELL